MARKPDFDAERHVDHMRDVLDLKIKPEWRDSVIAYMTNTADAAATIMDFPLDDDVEIAPTFKP